MTMHPAYFGVRFRLDETPSNWPQAFAILTAYQTTGQTWPERRNHAADHALLVQLREIDDNVFRLTGYSPETGHAEPGWAAAVGFALACDMGREYRQDAIFYVEHGELFVSLCDARRNKIFVATFASRLDRPTG